MKIVLEIPEEFVKDYNKDLFDECFERVLADIKSGIVCGNYEIETIEMLKESFRKSKMLYPLCKKKVIGNSIPRCIKLVDKKYCFGKICK